MHPNVVAIICVVSLALIATTAATRGGHVASSNDNGPAVVRRTEQRLIKYQNFVDYLSNIGNEVIKATQVPQPTQGARARPNGPSDDVDFNTGSGDDRADDTTTHTPEEPRPDEPSPAYDLDILGYFRDVPRQHWSCCMLGKLAGDKGFHCYAGFYAARIQTRNRNRAHNKKMHFHGQDAIPDYGRDVMHTFQRCVATQGDEFHKCCYAATIESRERTKWSRYAAQSQIEHKELIDKEVDEEEAEEQVERQEERLHSGRSQGHRVSHTQQQRQHGHQQQGHHGQRRRSNRPTHSTT